MNNLTGFTLRIIRLFLFFIPFFTSVVFGDRPVNEVLRANRMFTVIFVLLLAVSFTLALTTKALSGLRHHTKELEQKAAQLEVELNSSNRHIDTLREELTACVPFDYDAGRIFDRLRRP